MKATVLALALLATPAWADGSGSGEEPLPKIEVAVGSTVEQDVASFRGIRCDDLQIIDVGLQTRNDHNYFVVTGKAVGETLCRVGTDTIRPGLLFRVRVVASKKGGVK